MFEHANQCRDNTGRSGDVPKGTHANEHAQRRRRFLHAISASVLASAALTPAVSRPAHAACLSGDIRAECIGVYKLPVDAGESQYVDSPETLALYAPDLKWIPPVEYPSGYAAALRQLRDQRRALDSARELAAKGELEGTGLIFLDVIPKTTASGITLLKSFSDAANKERNAAMKKTTAPSGGIGIGIGVANPSTTKATTALEMRAYRVENALTDLAACLGEADILIGQGMRGALGVSAPAQIEVLAQIADCRREFDALLELVPETLASLG